jgi:hypothetical protein
MQKGNTGVLIISGILVASGLLALTFTAVEEARTTPRTGWGEPAESPAHSAAIEAGFVRLLHFDRNLDGFISRDDLIGKRLHHLFAKADIDGDNVLAPEELSAMYRLYHEENTAQGRGRTEWALRKRPAPERSPLPAQKRLHELRGRQNQADGDDDKADVLLTDLPRDARARIAAEQ